MNSPKNPSTKISEGSPSMIKLIALPRDKLPIKTIARRVANFQYADLNTPKIQIPAIPRYKHITTLKTFFISMESMETSNSRGNTFSGNKPYISPAGIITAIEISRWRFFLFI